MAASDPINKTDSFPPSVLAYRRLSTMPQHEYMEAHKKRHGERMDRAEKRYVLTPTLFPAFARVIVSSAHKNADFWAPKSKVAR